VTTTVTSAAPRESGAGVQVDDWACDCFMASPIVRPELADDEERDR